MNESMGRPLSLPEGHWPQAQLAGFKVTCFSFRWSCIPADNHQMMPAPERLALRSSQKDFSHAFSFLPGFYGYRISDRRPQLLFSHTLNAVRPQPVCGNRTKSLVRLEGMQQWELHSKIRIEGTKGPCFQTRGVLFRISSPLQWFFL